MYELEKDQGEHERNAQKRKCRGEQEKEGVTDVDRWKEGKKKIKKEKGKRRECEVVKKIPHAIRTIRWSTPFFFCSFK